MAIIIKDDRTDEQRATHTWAVVGTDSFMSGWGRAAHGLSYAAWATTPGNLDNVEYEIRRRGDMKRVRIVKLDNYRPTGAAHLHIYVR